MKENLFEKWTQSIWALLDDNPNLSDKNSFINFMTDSDTWWPVITILKEWELLHVKINNSNYWLYEWYYNISNLIHDNINIIITWEEEINKLYINSELIDNNIPRIRKNNWKNTYHSKNINIYKSLFELLDDLKDHLFLLNLSIENHNKHSSYFKLMSSELRTLVNKGEWGHLDLLLFIAKQFSIDLEIIIDTPIDMWKKIKLITYLERKDQRINEVDISNMAFIKLMANKSWEWLHVREYTDPCAYSWKKAKVWNTPVNYLVLLWIANQILKSGKYLLTEISKIHEDKIKTINEKYMKNGEIKREK